SRSRRVRRAPRRRRSSGCGPGIFLDRLLPSSLRSSSALPFLPYPHCELSAISGQLSAWEYHRQVARAADLAARPRNGARVFEWEVRDAVEPLLDRDAHFHAGEVGASAAVDADAESDVRVELAVEDDLVR